MARGQGIRKLLPESVYILLSRDSELFFLVILRFYDEVFVVSNWPGGFMNELSQHVELVLQLSVPAAFCLGLGQEGIPLYLERFDFFQKLIHAESSMYGVESTLGPRQWCDVAVPVTLFERRTLGVVLGLLKKPLRRCLCSVSTP